MRYDSERLELTEDDLFPTFNIYQDDDDGMYLIALPDGGQVISYNIHKCLYAYGMAQNTLKFGANNE